MQARTVRRFKRSTILLHWSHALAFMFLITTGPLMLFRLTGSQGHGTVLNIHRVAAVLLVAAPVAYAILNPGAVAGFIREAFKWDRDDLEWLKYAPRYYRGGREDLAPPQGRANGDQKLWQAVVILTGLTSAATGTVQWFFMGKIPWSIYAWVRTVHSASFYVLLALFAVHFYLRTFHPRFVESLSSMIDGKVSEIYARKHYKKWFDSMVRKGRS